MPDAPLNYRVADLAVRWRCSPGKVRSMVASGDLPCLRLGKLVRIPATSVIAYEARCLTQADPASSASPDATHGTSTTTSVASLRAARIGRRLNEHADADLNAAAETARDLRSASTPDPFASIADLAHMLADRDLEVRRLRSLVMATDREWALSERGSRITPGLHDAMDAVVAYCREWKA